MALTGKGNAAQAVALLGAPDETWRGAPAFDSLRRELGSLYSGRECAWQESNPLPFGPEPSDRFEFEYRVLGCDRREFGVG